MQRKCSINNEIEAIIFLDTKRISYVQLLFFYYSWQYENSEAISMKSNLKNLSPHGHVDNN